MENSNEMNSVAVVFGGPSPEHDISVLTGLQACRLLAADGVDAVGVYWTKSGQWLRVPPDVEAVDFLEPTVRGASALELHVPGGFVESKRFRGGQALEVDVVLNCCHGGAGEDGSLEGLLRLCGLRVTGPSAAASAVMMDKLATTGVAAQCGVGTIPTVLLGDDDPELEFPWVVKPRFGGSSLSVEAGVGDVATARSLAARGVSRAGCLIQPYLDGWVDLNIAYRSHPIPQLSAIERPLRDREAILDYQAKYLRGADGLESTPRELPAVIPDEIAERIRSATMAVAAALSATGIPRFDYLWDGQDRVLLCEVNAVPGALGLYLWETVGVGRVTVLRDLLDEARRSPVWPAAWAATSDGSALRVSRTIAAKLAL